VPILSRYCGRLSLLRATDTGYEPLIRKSHHSDCEQSPRYIVPLQHFERFPGTAGRDIESGDAVGVLIPLPLCLFPRKRCRLWFRAKKFPAAPKRSMSTTMQLLGRCQPRNIVPLELERKSFTRERRELSATQATSSLGMIPYCVVVQKLFWRAIAHTERLYVIGERGNRLIPHTTSLPVSRPLRSAADAILPSLSWRTD
jgi:hypothetical protein